MGNVTQLYNSREPQWIHMDSASTELLMRSSQSHLSFPSFNMLFIQINPLNQNQVKAVNTNNVSSILFSELQRANIWKSTIWS